MVAVVVAVVGSVKAIVAVAKTSKNEHSYTATLDDEEAAMDDIIANEIVGGGMAEEIDIEPVQIAPPPPGIVLQGLNALAAQPVAPPPPRYEAGALVDALADRLIAPQERRR